jgi:hypothetical protein
MPQILTRITAVKEGRLQYRVFRECRLYAAGINLTSRLPLQIFVPANMVCIGVGIQYGSQMPAVLIQYLPDLPPGILIIPAVNQIDMIPVRNIDTDLCRAVYVIAFLTDLYQFIHFSFPPYSAVSYYFGRKPFLLKQEHPLNYTIELFCFLPDGTKRLFSGNEKQKSPKNDRPATEHAINPWNYPRTCGIIQITTAKLGGKNYGIYKSA